MVGFVVIAFVVIFLLCQMRLHMLDTDSITDGIVAHYVCGGLYLINAISHINIVEECLYPWNWNKWTTTQWINWCCKKIDQMLNKE